MLSSAYLDANATAPLRPAAREAMAAALALEGNPSSVHRYGRLARRMVEDAREAVARLVGARPDQIVFTSGGTEANALALKGTAAASVLVSAIEHVSVLAGSAQRIAVLSSGVIDLDALERALAGASKPVLVSVMLANNETGVIQPIARVVEIARAHGTIVHCDAVQAIGRMPVNFAALGVDLMTVSSHKIGGPQGAGALIVGDRVALAPFMQGGGQERGRRPGTENVAAIAGFGAAASAIAAEPNEPARVAALRDALERRALAAVPGATIYGVESPRLGNTSCLGMPGVASETQVIALDLAGVAVSAGAACSSGKVRASHVLSAMGHGSDAASSAVRVSLSWRSTADDTDRFIEAWTALWRRVGKSGKDMAAARAAAAPPAA
ncbi:MAG: cysteine desulfurase [Alphaproteobacteria bacterium]|nr:cysteine desulfurase [Alphaproteobacteria bacterium]